MGASGSLQRLQKWNKIQKNNLVIKKRGQLWKQSKYLKDWRRQDVTQDSRNVIIVNQYVISFDQDHFPTAIINISQITHLLKQDKDNFFLLQIHTKSQSPFLFKTLDQYERDQWFCSIKAEKIFMMRGESNFSIAQTFSEGSQQKI